MERASEVFGLVVINAHLRVLARCRKHGSFLIEVNAVKILVVFLTHCVETLTTCGVPMLDEAISMDGHEHVPRFGDG